MELDTRFLTCWLYEYTKKNWQLQQQKKRIASPRKKKTKTKLFFLFFSGVKKNTKGVDVSNSLLHVIKPIWIACHAVIRWALDQFHLAKVWLQLCLQPSDRDAILDDMVAKKKQKEKKGGEKKKVYCKLKMFFWSFCFFYLLIFFLRKTFCWKERERGNLFFRYLVICFSFWFTKTFLNFFFSFNIQKKKT